MKLKQVIGGLEEMYDPTKTNQPDYPDDYKKGKVIGHNQLCNREVEINREELRKSLSSALHYCGAGVRWVNETERDTILNYIAKAISEGKILTLKNGRSKV